MVNKKITQNPFEILGIDKNASSGDVKKAYFQMVKQFRPEHHAEKFKQIRQAYDRLKDDSQRVEAEVFSFIKPTVQPESTEQATPEIKLEKEVFLSWWRRTYTDLERTDFASDFHENI